MAVTEQRQRVRFTGKRTGRADMPIPGIGIVQRGDVIEVSAEEAERWTADLPGPDGKDVSDFVKVGGAIKVSEENAEGRSMAQREKISKRAGEDDYAPDVPVAHEADEDSGTVEEFAEAIKEDGPPTIEAQKKA